MIHVFLTTVWVSVDADVYLNPFTSSHRLSLQHLTWHVFHSPLLFFLFFINEKLPVRSIFLFLNGTLQKQRLFFFRIFCLESPIFAAKTTVLFLKNFISFSLFFFSFLSRIIFLSFRKFWVGLQTDIGDLIPTCPQQILPPSPLFCSFLQIWKPRKKNMQKKPPIWSVNCWSDPGCEVDSVWWLGWTPWSSLPRRTRGYRCYRVILRWGGTGRRPGTGGKSGRSPAGRRRSAPPCAAAALARSCTCSSWPFTEFPRGCVRKRWRKTGGENCRGKRKRIC